LKRERPFVFFVADTITRRDLLSTIGLNGGILVESVINDKRTIDGTEPRLRAAPVRTDGGA